MKKLLLSLLFGIQIFYLSAQLSPWIEKGATWTYSNWAPGYGMMDKIEYKKDSLILGKICQVLITTTYYYGQTAPGAPISLIYSQNRPIQFTYSNGDTVFYLVNNSFEVLYNFGLSKGDSWDLGVDTNGYYCGKSIIVVDSVSSMTIGANTHRVLYVHDSTGNSSVEFHGYIIEHIGGGYLFPIMQNCGPPIPDFEPHYSFLCFNDDSVFYQLVSSGECSNPYHVGLMENKLSDNTISIFPNPSNGFLKIETSNTQLLNIEIVDMFGSVIQKLTSNKQSMNVDLSNYSNGIYFVRIMDEEGRVGVKKIVKQ